ncbi:hypothetical protein GGX14DRAFT_670702 [Mycena pura]|uniref:Peptidase M20 dimerisation domain-containing protein n=1 Tax=Mycena pura TaxID=153505 RepID=A0AAD6YKP7_9AGAR|nr:hypothetical protein GGX14DRAFT_670702 [Mycena pura]
MLPIAKLQIKARIRPTNQSVALSSRTTSSGSPSKILLEERPFRALTGTTQVVNIIGGGVKSNALSEQAAAVVNYRRFLFSVNTTTARAVALVRPLAVRFNLFVTAFGERLPPADAPIAAAPLARGHDPRGIRVRCHRRRASADPGPAIVTDTDTRKADEGLFVLHGVMVGNDTGHTWALSRHIFQYAHNLLDLCDLNGMHTVNERIRADAFFIALILNVDERRSAAGKATPSTGSRACAAGAWMATLSMSARVRVWTAGMAPASVSMGTVPAECACACAATGASHVGSPCKWAARTMAAMEETSRALTAGSAHYSTGVRSGGTSCPCARVLSLRPFLIMAGSGQLRVLLWLARVRMWEGRVHVRGVLCRGGCTDSRDGSAEGAGSMVALRMHARTGSMLNAHARNAVGIAMTSAGAGLVHGQLWGRRWQAHVQGRRWRACVHKATWGAGARACMQTAAGMQRRAHAHGL